MFFTCGFAERAVLGYGDPDGVPPGKGQSGVLQRLCLHLHIAQVRRNWARFEWGVNCSLFTGHTSLEGWISELGS